MSTDMAFVALFLAIEALLVLFSVLVGNHEADLRPVIEVLLTC